MMQACAVHRFPDRLGPCPASCRKYGQGPGSSQPTMLSHSTSSLEWSWKKGWLLVVTFLLFQRGPPGGHTSGQAVVC